MTRPLAPAAAAHCSVKSSFVKSKSSALWATGVLAGKRTSETVVMVSDG